MPSPETVILVSGLAFVVLLIWLLTLISSAIYSDNSEDTAKSADQRDQPNYPQQNIQHEVHAALAAITDAIHSHGRILHSEDRHRSKREKVTIAVLGATAVFALFAAAAAIASAWIFQGQLNEMRVERRPWVSISEKDSVFQAEPSTALVNSPLSGPRLGIRMRIRNSGRSPALRIRILLRLVSRAFPSAAEPNLIDEQRSLCDQAAKAAPPNNKSSWYPEVTIFPGDEIPIAQIAVGGPTSIGKTITTPSIIGCILYDSPILAETPYTGIILDVFRSGAGIQPGSTDSLIELQPGNQIDAPQLALKFNPIFGIGPAY